MNAEILDTPRPQFPATDDICRTYQQMLDELAALRVKHESWGVVLGFLNERDSEDQDSFLAELQKEIDERKLSWEHIKTKDFPQSQAEVKAMSWIMRRLIDAGVGLDDQIRAKRKLILEYEINNELILIGGGYKIDKASAQKEVMELTDKIVISAEQTEGMAETMGELEPGELEPIDDEINGAYTLAEHESREDAAPVVSKRGRKGK